MGYPSRFGVVVACLIGSTFTSAQRGAASMARNQEAPASARNNTYSGSNSHTGSDFFKNINKRLMCDQFPGATFDAKVNGCIAAVIAQGGGIADATGLIGAQTHTAEIDVGNLSSVPVTLLTSPWLIDNIAITSTGACAFKIFNESRMMGTMHGITHSGVFQVSGSTSMGSVICSAGNAPSYISVQGAQIYNPNGATLTNGAVYAYNLLDLSEFRDLMISSYGTIGRRVAAHRSRASSSTATILRIPSHFRLTACRAIHNQSQECSSSICQSIIRGQVRTIS